ncbi:MAG TPA: uracil-DNA glycosylase family protein, partial [Gemmatimonadales bacterium]|nr:uracil-DNA glycosylase family protein [Gemmatimonadales bacterium]
MHRPILIVGEAWGAHEAKYRLPFVGPSGRLLNGFLKAAGVDPGKYVNLPDGETIIDWSASSEVYCTNVFNLQPRPTNDVVNLCGPRSEGIVGLPAVVPGKYIRKEYSVELDRLYREIKSIDPNIIIALGNTAIIALMQAKLPILKNRGNLFETPLTRPDDSKYKMLATYHPSYILRDNWKDRPIVITDLIKAKRHSHTPVFVRPSREIWIEPTLA